MTGHTYSQPLNISQESFVTVHRVDFQRLEQDTLSPSEINDRCRKLTFKKAYAMNTLQKIGEREYRVREQVWERVRDVDVPTLPCGCVDFQTVRVDGELRYECSCGVLHERATVEAYLERVP